MNLMSWFCLEGKSAKLLTSKPIWAASRKPLNWFEASQLACESNIVNLWVAKLVKLLTSAEWSPHFGVVPFPPLWIWLLLSKTCEQSPQTNGRVFVYINRFTPYCSVQTIFLINRYILRGRSILRWRDNSICKWCISTIYPARLAADESYLVM